MSLAEQWDEIERGLPADWADARLNLKLDDPRQADRAAALLGPLNPGRRNGELRFYTARRGAGPAPLLLRRLLARLDSAGVEGEVQLLASGETVAGATTQPPAFAGSRGAAGV